MDPTDPRNDIPPEFNNGMEVQSVDEPMSLQWTAERIARQAYMAGVLHGINAQSMAQVKNDVMEFDDYGWDPEGEHGRRD